jgi:putative ATP-dependent endonuclease of the OLD family
MICLIGPGDSTKTTILNAIEYALSPKWNLTFTDNDFYQSNVKFNLASK